MRTGVAIIYLTKEKAMPRNEPHDGPASDLESAGSGAHPATAIKTGDSDAEGSGRPALPEGSRAASAGHYAADDRKPSEDARETARRISKKEILSDFTEEVTAEMIDAGSYLLSEFSDQANDWLTCQKAAEIYAVMRSLACARQPES